jgi:hypothetical protein
VNSGVVTLPLEGPLVAFNRLGQITSAMMIKALIQVVLKCSGFGFFAGWFLHL